MYSDSSGSNKTVKFAILCAGYVTERFLSWIGNNNGTQVNASTLLFKWTSALKLWLTSIQNLLIQALIEGRCDAWCEQQNKQYRTIFWDRMPSEVDLLLVFGIHYPIFETGVALSRVFLVHQLIFWQFFVNYSTADCYFLFLY